MIIKYILIIACMLSFISYIYTLMKRNNNSNYGQKKMLQLKADIRLEYTLFLGLNLCMVLIPILPTVLIVFAIVIGEIARRLLHIGDTNSDPFTRKSCILGFQTSFIVLVISICTFVTIV